MDVLDWLETVVADCVTLASPAEAMSLVPDLSVDAPALVDVRLASEPNPWRGFPIRFSEEIRLELAGVLLDSVTRALASGERENIEELTLDALAGDPLVSKVARLLAEAGTCSRRASSLVMLELARQSADILGGGAAELSSSSPGTAARIRGQLTALNELPSRERGEAVGRVVWSLCGRLNAAWSLAARVQPALRPTRTWQAMVANRLVFAIPSSRSEIVADLAFVAGVLGLEVDAQVLADTGVAVHTAVTRALAGEGGAAGAGLRSMATGRGHPRGLALDPAIAGLALQSLAAFASARELRKAGVSKLNAKSLLKADGAAASAAVYAMVGSTIRSWDLLSALVGRVLPVQRSPRGHITRLGDLLPSVTWDLLTPRGTPRAEHLWVVGMDFSAATAAATELAARSGEVAVLAAAHGLWDRISERATHHEGLGGRSGSGGIAVFRAEARARQFAEEAEGLVRSPIRLALHPVGADQRLPAGVLVPVTVASGEVLGGWDGDRLALFGKPVSTVLGSRAELVGVPEGFSSTAEESSKRSIGDYLGARQSSLDDPPTDLDELDEMEATDPFGLRAAPDPFADGDDVQLGGAVEAVVDDDSLDLLQIDGAPDAALELDSGLSGGDDPFGVPELGEDAYSEPVLDLDDNIGFTEFRPPDTLVPEPPAPAETAGDPPSVELGLDTPLADLGQGGPGVSEIELEPLEDLEPIGDPVSVTGLEPLGPLEDEDDGAPLYDLSEADEDEDEDVATRVDVAPPDDLDEADSVGIEHSSDILSEIGRPSLAETIEDDDTPGHPDRRRHGEIRLPPAPGEPGPLMMTDPDAFESITPELDEAPPLDSMELEDIGLLAASVSVMPDARPVGRLSMDIGSEDDFEEPADSAQDEDSESDGDFVGLLPPPAQDDIPAARDASEPGHSAATMEIEIEDDDEDDEDDESSDSPFIPAARPSPFPPLELEPEEAAETRIDLAGSGLPIDRLDDAQTVDEFFLPGTIGDTEHSDLARSLQDAVDDDDASQSASSDPSASEPGLVDFEEDEPDSVPSFSVGSTPSFSIEIGNADADSASDFDFKVPDEIDQDPADELAPSDFDLFEAEASNVLEGGVSELGIDADRREREALLSGVSAAPSESAEADEEPEEDPGFSEGAFSFSIPETVESAAGTTLTDTLPLDTEAETELVEEPAQEPAKKSSSVDIGPNDLAYLFDGYVSYTTNSGQTAFARRYGSRLLDLHTYDHPDLDGAYQAFATDKVREGFVPRTDLAGDVPPGASLRPLDMDRMNRAFATLG